MTSASSTPEPLHRLGNVPLISIITPCFNGEHHVGRLIESVLAQTYPYIEFILVNDGSTDGTNDVVHQFMSRLDEELTRFVYVEQANTGLGGAINAGLQHVTGEYLCWPDADDYLEPTSVRLRVEALEAHPDCAVVTSDAFLRSAEDPERVIGRISESYRDNPEPRQFERLLRANSIFVSGCHMVRMSSFDETHPGRMIYPAKRGQNWQMLLPLYHKHKRLYLDVPLYNIVVSGQSMSRSDTRLLDKIYRIDEHLEIRQATLDSIPMPAAEHKHWKGVVEQLHAQAATEIYLAHGDRDMAVQGFKVLNERHSLTPKQRWRLRAKLMALRLRHGLGLWVAPSASEASDGGSENAGESHVTDLTSSVLVTTYNGARFIEEQLDSILKQSERVDQVLVFDDQSGDETASVVNAFLDRHEPANWSFTVNETNLGPANNVLDHLSLLTGDIVFLADQDDIWHVDKVRTMKDYLGGRPESSMVVSRTEPIDASGHELAAPLRKRARVDHGRIQSPRLKTSSTLSLGDFLGHSTVPLHAMCVRRNVLEEITEAGAFPKLSRSLGADWYIGIWSVALGVGELIPNILVKRRVHDTNVSLGRIHKTTLLASTQDDRLAMLAEANAAHQSLLQKESFLVRLTDRQRKLLHQTCQFQETRADLASNPNPLKAAAILRHARSYVRSADGLLSGLRMWAADVAYALNINWRLPTRGVNGRNS